MVMRLVGPGERRVVVDRTGGENLQEFSRAEQLGIRRKNCDKLIT